MRNLKKTQSTFSLLWGKLPCQNHVSLQQSEEINCFQSVNGFIMPKMSPWLSQFVICLLGETGVIAWGPYVCSKWDIWKNEIHIFFVMRQAPMSESRESAAVKKNQLFSICKWIYNGKNVTLILWICHMFMGEAGGIAWGPYVCSKWEIWKTENPHFRFKNPLHIFKAL